MQQQVELTSRDAILVEDARPSDDGLRDPRAPAGAERALRQVDPFILVHEARFRLPELQDVDTKHPHRGFDNLWYILQGSASTGHSTGPDGAFERARLPEGALLALRTGTWRMARRGRSARRRARRPWRYRVAERALLGEPRSQGQAGRAERAGAAAGADHRSKKGDATVRVLVGEGSP